MSRGEGELLTVPKPRAVGLLSVCLTVKPVGEPDALIGHVRFDERGWETERCRMAQATAPILDSTECNRTSASASEEHKHVTHDQQASPLGIGADRSLARVSSELASPFGHSKLTPAWRAH